MFKSRSELVLFITAAAVWICALSASYSDDATKLRWLIDCARKTGGSVVKETSESLRTAASRGNGFDYYVQLSDGRRINYGERYADTTDRFPLP